MADSPKLTREMALDWMAKTGGGARKCTNHFRELGYECSENTVKYWARVAKQRGQTRPKPAKQVAAGKPVKGSTSSRTKLHVADMAPESQHDLLAIRDKLIRYLKGEAVAEADQVAGLLASEELELDKRERHRLEAVLGQVTWNPRGAQAAITALGILIDKAPDILNFQRAVENGGKATEDEGIGGDEAADRLTEVLST